MSMNITPGADHGPRRATMQDVARTAGVSLKSVSRVINNESHVSPGLRARVEAAIAALNYVPDIAARSLAGQRHFVIGMLLDNPSPHYTMELVSGAYRACREKGYTLQFDNINAIMGAGGLDVSIEVLLRDNRTDGFILTPPLSDNRAVLDALEARGIAYVRVAPVRDPGRSPAVVIDDYSAAGEIADHFWLRGHRRLAFVTGHPDHAAAISRRDGFLDRLKQHDPHIAVTEANGDFTFDGGIAAGQALLAPDQRPTAIFAANDDTAAGVMVAASRMQLHVPGDVSVIGFDDSWVAKSVWPYLTTIRQPISEMGYAAAQLLLDRQAARDVVPFPVLRLDYQFVARDSVGDAA